MTLRLHNTASRKVEDFSSSQAVKLYTCGPTVYDRQHVGNWAAYIYWDTLVRILQVNNYQVERVLNITDVGHLVSDGDDGEDKLERGAKREGKTAWQIAELYTKDFLGGIAKLNLTRPNHIARATDFIQQQTDLVLKLKQAGYTYQIDDGIYFNTAKFSRYADFARLNLEELQAGARIGVNLDKKNPSDFALWKFTPAGVTRDMEWETPKNLLDDSTDTPVMGFPGWHLECSAIAMSILGQSLDIHTGGIDHIPVHHTNEIAQSESVTNKTFSRFWLHNNHMKVDGSKISKSLGNGYTLQDIEGKGFSALDFKMLVLQSHYQSESNFSFELLEAAKNRLSHWRSISALRWQIDTLPQNQPTTDTNNRASKLIQALNNNLDTPSALKLVDEYFHEVTTKPINHRSLVSLLEIIDSTLGLKLIESTPDIPEAAKQMIAKREAARNNKDWALSDQIRDEIASHFNLSLRDTAGGSIWSYI